ncbi:SRPBCC family protein [Amycolatopsis echigonensis]|uniref:Polyketide cyclase/dehydrase/lipid transport protein n=1 Tax=Amycolatopsis echigonensis TaxID=2576905 RepID=A0A2N3WS52_9PSEU|nr:SRPBCC family protein [Amycolatopsis niigatensis]PKV96702.1 polyketide cyclase/dehydrase/lipid transport protein [Amycolatopsis niigatensis]
MTRVEATSDLPVPPDELWGEVGSFQRIGDWHPMLAEVSGEGESPGARRTATTSDGEQQVERLTEIDPENWFYRYEMESGALPVRDCFAEFRVRPDGEGGSTVQWSSEFEVVSPDYEATRDAVRQFLAAGVRALHERYG